MNDTAENTLHDFSCERSVNCLPVGTRFAEFEIRDIIGEGGFGIVYLAFDESLQRTVAIKEYMPAVLAGRGADKSVEVRSRQHQETFDKGLRSFINEARLLAQFDHPALIKVYRFWEQNNTGYMAMRCYEGRTLKNIVGENSSLVSEAWLKSILTPILGALETLYRVNVLHRDISPDNILVQDNGQAVLLDFGAARQIISDITQALTVILKPGYAPVEQYADDESMIQGPWTDIYSLSAVVYFAIVKKAPPTSVGRMIKDPLEPLQNGAHAGFSREFLAAIDKGLGIRPEDRPQSIDEFRRLLGIDPSGQAAAETLSAMMPGVRLRDERMREMASSTARRKASGQRRKNSLRSWVKAVLSRRRFRIGTVVALSGAIFLLLLLNEKPGNSPQAMPRNAAIAAAGPVEQIVDDETISWELLAENPNPAPEEIRKYLHAYPNGKHAQQARERLAEMPVPASVPAANMLNATPAHVAFSSGVKPEKSNEKIRLLIKPWGNVFVDGVLEGVSPPLKTLTLARGKHRIKIDNPNFSTRVIDFEVKGRKREELAYDFNSSRK